MNEFIICAANYYNDNKIHDHEPINIKIGFVLCGRRHHNCITTFARIGRFPYNKKWQKIHNTEVQGFLTNTNKFVDRLEGLEIARKANQLITGNGNSNLGLFSEDLY